MSRNSWDIAQSRQRLIFTGTGFREKDGADWTMHWVGKLSEKGMQNAYYCISEIKKAVPKITWHSFFYGMYRLSFILSFLPLPRCPVRRIQVVQEPLLAVLAQRLFPGTPLVVAVEEVAA